MFILRKKVPVEGTENQYTESNTILGECYMKVMQFSGPDYEKIINSNEFFSNQKENICGFITYDAGEGIIPLYRGQNNYIMTTNGSTFDSITFK